MLPIVSLIYFITIFSGPESTIALTVLYNIYLTLESIYALCRILENYEKNIKNKTAIAIMYFLLEFMCIYMCVFAGLKSCCI